MAYTFAVDTGKIADLVSQLESARDHVETGINEIFSSIDNMEGAVWAGTSYTTFNKGAHAYETALKTLDEVIEAFRSELERLGGDPANDCIQAVQDAVTSMSGD